MLGLRAWWKKEVQQAGWSVLGDIALAIALVVFAIIPGTTHQGANLGQLPSRPLDTLGVVTLLAQCLPLVARQRWPAGCLAVVGIAFAVFQLRGYPYTFASLGLLVALYSAGAHLARNQVAVAGAAVGAYAVLSVGLHVEHSPERPVDYVTFALMLAIAWGIGAWMRARSKEITEKHRLTEEAAVAAERARIARDLHDVVTHHVTAMVLQSEAGQFLTERTGEAFSAIGDAGRQALTDLRRLLDVLDRTDQESSSVAGLLETVDRSRSAGQPIELVEHGRPRPMTEAARTVAARVIQEALTNALKHAPGERTVVSVRYGDDWLDLEVMTDRAGRPGLGRGGGRGLAGLRERVCAAGGDLSVGADPDGAFTVRARIPVGDPMSGKPTTLPAEG